MAATGERFGIYQSREKYVFSRFLENFDQKPSFAGIKEALSLFQAHPEGTEDYDIRCKTKYGYLTFDVQESNDFSKYGDIRIDYVSSFFPASYKTDSLEQFKKDSDKEKVKVEKWGKVVLPTAEFLVYEYHNGKTWWQIYDLKLLNELLPEIEKIGYFKINKKFGEAWGSAFIAVNEGHKIINSVKPKNLEQILKRSRELD